MLDQAGVASCSLHAPVKMAIYVVGHLSRTQSAMNSCATEQILLERRGAMLKLCRLTAADTQSNTCSANNAVQQVLCARVHVYHVFGQNLAALLIGSCVYFCNSVGV